MNINYKLKLLLPYLYIFLFAYGVNAVLFSYLPKNSIQNKIESKNQINYSTYNTFFNKAPLIKEEESMKKEYFTVDKIRVKAIYAQKNNEGLAILEDKNTKKSSIITVGQNFKTYTLKKLFNTYIILEKDEKEYKVVLLKLSSNVEYSINKEKKEELKISQTGISISRVYLNTYMNNLSKVWNNISIKEIKIKNKIKGFQIINITQNSMFDKLGLKKGDVIKRVNKKNIDSSAYAFELYKNINEMEHFSVEVLRNNKMVELNYEIN